VTLLTPHVARRMDVVADVAMEPCSLRSANQFSPSSTQVAPDLSDSRGLASSDGRLLIASDSLNGLAASLTDDTHQRAAISDTMKKPVSASVEQLKGEVAVARKQADTAEREARRVDNDHRRLVEQVVGLEAQRRSLQQDVEHWRQQSVGFESESAAFRVREDTLLAQLREARTHERDLALKSIEGRILCTQAENLQAKAQAEARANTWQSQQLEAKLLSKNAEVETLRNEVRDAHARGEASRVEAEGLQVQLRAAVGEQSGQSEALIDAERKHDVLEDRIARLESALKAASAKHTAFAQEVAKKDTETWNLEEKNGRLRLDLQAAICQAVCAGEVPFYSGGGGRFQKQAACVEDFNDVPAMGVCTSMEPDSPCPLSSPVSPQHQHPAKGPLSPRSRLDYPKSTHARHLRQKVLSARGEAYDCMDQLGRERQ